MIEYIGDDRRVLGPVELVVEIGVDVVRHFDSGSSAGGGGGNLRRFLIGDGVGKTQTMLFVRQRSHAAFLPLAVPSLSALHFNYEKRQLRFHQAK